MTKKKENAVTSDADVAAENEASESVSSGEYKMEYAGEQPSLSNKLTPLMMTLLVAIPSVAIVAYINWPDQLDELVASVQESGNGLNNSGVPSAANSSIESWARPQPPEWVAQHRTEMKKRRTEFEKQNTEQSSANDVSSNFTPPEPPLWIKEQHARMEQERARYQEQMAKQRAAMNNMSPEYMMQPGMNRPQMSGVPANNQAAVWQNPNPAYAYPQIQQPYYNGYPQPTNPYYNVPNYYGPYGAPYGYPYR
ncbi:MAG: hypothetical protein OEZ15_02020 [Gammaproteobacteria bacterium]|nr:hypothetical protein [Gammaproteobacteria bacterium]